MNKIQRSKKFQLFLEGYDSRADARLDSILEEPCKDGTKSAPIVCCIRKHQNQYDVLTKVSTRKHFSEYTHLLK